MAFRRLPIIIMVLVIIALLPPRLYPAASNSRTVINAYEITRKSLQSEHEYNAAIDLLPSSNVKNPSCPQALTVLEKLANENKYSPAQNELGTLYFYGECVPLNYQKAFYWYEISAKNNNSAAQYNLGFLYEQGLGTPASSERAKHWYLKSGHHGYDLAEERLGYIYLRGELGEKQNYDEALYWLGRAVEHGSLPATYTLGRLYVAGEGIVKNKRQGIMLISQSAQQGYPLAQSYLGYAYLYGDGVEKNSRQAYYWLEKAANNKSPEGQYYLALYYLTGKEADKNKDKIIQLLTDSARQDNPLAYYQLGVVYQFGELGVKLNLEQALAYFEKAAALGHIDSQLKLACLYYSDQKISDRLEITLRWLKEAHKNQTKLQGVFADLELSTAQGELVDVLASDHDSEKKLASLISKMCPAILKWH